MAWVEKRGKKWSVCWRETDALGAVTRKRSSYFDTKEDAWAAAKELERSSNAGIDIHGDTQTCGYWMERWFTEHCLGRIEQTTICKYSDAMDALRLLPIYEMPVRKLTRQSLNAVIFSLGEGGKRSPRRCNDLTEPWRFSLSWAEKNGYIPINPLRGASQPAQSVRRQVILNDADIASLSAESIKTSTSPKKGSVRGGAFGIPIHLALYGGLRREETAALTWDNVDFVRNSITIVEAHARASNGERIIKAPKTAASRRTISMPQVVMRLLKASPRLGQYVCVNASGAPLELSGYAQAVRRCVDRINKQRQIDKVPPMPRASYHDLRHTHAAYLIRLGLHAKIIQERLGHTSIKITMDLYGYLMTGLQESVAIAIDAAQEQTVATGGKTGGTDAKKAALMSQYEHRPASNSRPKSKVE